MTANEAFLRAIHDEPHDPVHRLVYADWLEEQGDLERAAFVRVQAERRRRDPNWAVDHALLHARELRLWEVNAQRWGAEDGFAALSPPRDDFNALFSPERDQWLDLSVGDVPPERPAGRDRISVYDRAVDDATLSTLASAGWAGLKEVSFYRCRFHHEAIARLFESPHLAALEALTLRGSAHPLDGRGLAALLGNPALTRLQRLEIVDTAPLMPEDATAALRGCDLPALRWLNLGTLLPSWRDGAALGESPVAPRLEGLKVLGPAAKHLHSGDFRSLRRLDVPFSRLTDALIMRLVAAGWFRGVEYLDLSGNHLLAAGARELARARHLAGLRVLLLSGNRITDKGLVPLLKSPHLAGLRQLELEETGLGDDTFAALCAAPMLGSLEVLLLDLDNGRWGEDEPFTLAATGRCRNLQRIWWDDHDPKGRRVQIDAAFGVGVFWHDRPHP